ncbi:HigA family addiction module antitoxin [Avibacterium paragallinarum]|uniref:Addiction module antidote protein, HigA family n=1 Tax=Avibacterium paragallinarum TaxID=728 RepID=A0A0F5EXK1_AVIPA|nr:HigA family addiction module antitoxin [Avibacterium paragallinarum]KAA6209078.1 HigA family addiction module antidote protein [Avibacterium paragallinarum]KKB01256.1 XRE family transcriptional regulator [Avibacterium paragallinarum]MEE3607959.1 HigA family addiction module antitoxin [Avibacterium paragallinarum]MEE3620950.1 HigA family addiction module antitoxin [Avibacterium paragallinarum]MEE3667991.1 HigA family addiction module antitoxin [Avibacterium paragallinarum]
MFPTQRKPTSVGEILQEEFLLPLNLKINDLAEILDVHRNTASNLVSNHSKVTLEMAVKLAKAFGTSPEFWINLQNAVDLWELNHNDRFQQSLSKVKIAHYPPAFSV